MDVIRTKRATSASLRLTIFEVGAFNITSTHQSFGRCDTVSRVSKIVWAKAAYIAGNSSRSAKQSDHTTRRDQRSVCVCVCILRFVAFDVTLS